MYLDQGNRYAYGQILLLAMVCSTRKLDLSNPLLRRIVYSAINNAAAFVRRMQSGGKQPMICSEFVYRAYDEAILPDKDDIYTIEIEPLWPTRPVDGRLAGGAVPKRRLRPATSIPIASWDNSRPRPAISAWGSA